MKRTALEAGDWGRDLDAPREKVRKTRKESKKSKPQDGSTDIQSCRPPHGYLGAIHCSIRHAGRKALFEMIRTSKSCLTTMMRGCRGVCPVAAGASKSIPGTKDPIQLQPSPTHRSPPPQLGAPHKCLAPDPPSISYQLIVAKR